MPKSVENPFNDQGWTAKQVEIEEVKIERRYCGPITRQREDERMAETLERMRRDHPAPDTQVVQCGKKLTRKEKREARKIDPDGYPQLWELEGPRGIHNIMQKRPSPNVQIAPPQQEIVDQEMKDWRSQYPRKNGWGPFHNQTREEFSEDFLNKCRNNIQVVRKWVEENPNNPYAEYLKRYILDDSKINTP